VFGSTMPEVADRIRRRAEPPRSGAWAVAAVTLAACSPQESVSPAPADPGAVATPATTTAPPPAPADPVPTAGTGNALVGNAGAGAGIEPCPRSPADIMAVIGRHSLAINKCLVAGQRQKRLTKGTRTVDLEFLVMPAGKIEGVQVHDKDTRDNTLQLCIGKVLDGVRFPAVKGGNCPVTLPLNVASGHVQHRPRSR
jgi:hypothetical protein